MEDFGIEGFEDLTPKQKLVAMAYFRHRDWSKVKLAQECGVTERMVYNLFASEGFDKINRSFAATSIRKLRLMAVDTLERAMKGPNMAVAASVAKSILASDGLIREAPKEVLEKQEISVAWNGGMKPIDVTPQPERLDQAKH